MVNRYVVKHEQVFTSAWFDLVAKTVRQSSSQEEDIHYSIQTHDYVSIVAQTPRQQLVFVRQYRPAVEAITIELPGGHVDPGEDPAQSARRELFEETGFEVAQVHYLGTLLPDTGRLSNQMWCYFAADAYLIGDKQEQGVQRLLWTPEQLALGMAQGQFIHALHLAVLMLAQAYGFLAPVNLPPAHAFLGPLNAG